MCEKILKYYWSSNTYELWINSVPNYYEYYKYNFFLKSIYSIKTAMEGLIIAFKYRYVFEQSVKYVRLEKLFNDFI